MVTTDDKIICAAVKRLRLELGDTQQEFAQRLGLAISTVVRYEHHRAPKGKQLALLGRVAGENGLIECWGIFQDSLRFWLGLTDESTAKIGKIVGNQMIREEKRREAKR